MGNKEIQPLSTDGDLVFSPAEIRKKAVQVALGGLCNQLHTGYDGAHTSVFHTSVFHTSAHTALHLSAQM